MARSSYVWLVFEKTLNSMPLATFTVKKELKRWLRDWERPENFIVARFADAGLADARRFSTVTTYDVEELLASA